MATVSSHILDSVSGQSAVGIRCVLKRLDGNDARQMLFDVKADHEGRISEKVDIDESFRGSEYELEIHAAPYFAAQSLGGDSIVKTLVIRFAMDDPERRYHLPVMLSPHSYSTWWSR